MDHLRNQPTDNRDRENNDHAHAEAVDIGTHGNLDGKRELKPKKTTDAVFYGNENLAMRYDDLIKRTTSRYPYLARSEPFNIDGETVISWSTDPEWFKSFCNSLRHHISIAFRNFDTNGEQGKTFADSILEQLKRNHR